MDTEYLHWIHFSGPDNPESECTKCNGTGMVAIRSRDGAYAFPGPVPDDAKGYSDADCWYCDCAPSPQPQ